MAAICSITRAACICLKQIPKMGMCCSITRAACITAKTTVLNLPACSIAHAGDDPPNKVDIFDFAYARARTGGTRAEIQKYRFGSLHPRTCGRCHRRNFTLISPSPRRALTSEEYYDGNQKRPPDL